MTDLRVVGQRMLVLHFDDVSCVVLASDLIAIDDDGASARVSIDGLPCDLADYLPDCVGSGNAMRLIIEIDGVRRAFRTHANLELVETSLLYQMPRLLRDCGCAPWLRGIVLLEGTPDESDADHKRPALWLDLASLAHQKENREEA